MLEIVIEPGARKPEHVHRCPSVMIVDAPARIRYDESGTLTVESAAIVDQVPVRATWMDPERPHAVETSTRAPTTRSESSS